jgi:hypothetical protein
MVLEAVEVVPPEGPIFNILPLSQYISSSLGSLYNLLFEMVFVLKLTKILRFWLWLMFSFCIVQSQTDRASLGHFLRGIRAEDGSNSKRK